MTYLVDAHVLSEATKASPTATVVDWFRAHGHEFAVNPVILSEL